MKKNKKVVGSSSMRKQYPTHIFKEEEMEVWCLCESSLAAMAISSRMKKSYPAYKVCLCNRKTFLAMGGKL